MQPKFVSRFPRAFEIEQELYRYLHLTSPMMITSLVLLGVIFVVNIVMCLISGLLYANMAVFAMVVIVLFVLFYRYYSAIQAGKKRLAEDTNNKGEVTVTATLTDEVLISESSDREEPVCSTTGSSCSTKMLTLRPRALSSLSCFSWRDRIPTRTFPFISIPPAAP